MDRATTDRNKQRFENTMRVLDYMEDIRDIWRESAPLQNLTEEQTEKLKKKIEKARKSLDKIEASL